MEEGLGLIKKKIKKDKLLKEKIEIAHKDTGDAEGSKKKKKKKRKKRKKIAEAELVATVKPAALKESAYPFQIDKDDHCETPFEAYEHINVFLEALCERLRKSKSELLVYDPYYCQGAVKRNLAQLGYTQVYNECEDFYAQIERGATPKYDVLVTNPPYSGDHVQKILAFCVRQNRPWFLLVPNWAYTKPYYLDSLKLSEPWSHPFFLLPQTRYTYFTPQREKTSPFISFWYIDCQ